MNHASPRALFVDGVRLPGSRIAALTAILLFCALSAPVALHAGARQNAEPVAKTGPRFDGVEIVIGVMDSSSIGEPAERHAREWEARTGGRAILRKTPFAELFSALKEGASSDPAAIDVALYASGWTGDLVPHLTSVPDSLLKSASLQDVHPTYRDRLMAWEGRWVSVAIDGDLFLGYFRTDLFEDRGNRAAFRERYGRELAAPRTWAEYRDVAEFFTGRPGTPETGVKTMYGAAEVFKRGAQQAWTVFSRASAYANPPGTRGLQFFDPETMKAQVDNPAWVRAVTEYLDILAFAPPGAEAFALEDVREAFAQGRVAMIIEWADSAKISADPARSKIVDKVGYFVLPGARESYDPRAQEWKSFSAPHMAPFLAFGGWVAGVPKTSRKQAAAWDFIAWMSNPENSLHDVTTAGTGMDPYRYSHFAALDRWSKALSFRAASDFLGVVKLSLDSPSAALDLRIPGFNEYFEAFEAGLAAALTKDPASRKSPQAAMDQVAAAWERITDRLGRDRQRAIYRSSMGLPPTQPAPGATSANSANSARTARPGEPVGR